MPKIATCMTDIYNASWWGIEQRGGLRADEKLLQEEGDMGLNKDCCREWMTWWDQEASAMHLAASTKCMDSQTLQPMLWE